MRVQLRRDVSAITGPTLERARQRLDECVQAGIITQEEADEAKTPSEVLCLCAEHLGALRSTRSRVK